MHKDPEAEMSLGCSSHLQEVLAAGARIVVGGHEMKVDREAGTRLRALKAMVERRNRILIHWDQSGLKGQCWHR